MGNDRLKSLRVVDPVLTNIAQGYFHAEHIWSKILPVVEVVKEAGDVGKFGKESFLAYNTSKAHGARSARIDAPKGKVSYSLEPHAIEEAVDDEERDEAAGGPFDPLEDDARQTCQDIISLRHEIATAALVFNADTYAASNKVTLSGTDQLDDYVNSDPIDVIETLKAAVRSAIGINPNTMLLGATVYETLKFHPAYTSKIQYVQKAIATPDLIAALHDFKSVVVGNAVYAEGPDDDDDFIDIWGKMVWVGYVPPKPSRKTPAFGYTFRKKKRPLVDKYRDEPATSVVVRVRDKISPVVLGAGAGSLIIDAIG